MLQVNDANKQLVASGFLNNLANKVELAVATDSNDEAHLVFTNYNALTGDIVLAIANQALEDVKTEKALPASSSLIFEVNADKTIRGYLNDEEMVPAGCKGAKSCTSDLFVAALRQKVQNGGSFPEMAVACDTSEPDLMIEM